MDKTLRFEPDSIDLNGLAQLTKALKITSPPHIEVGIIGTKGEREGSVSNATIGAAHEYGAPAINLPCRSFLRMPIKDHLQSEMEESGLLGEAELKAVVKTGTIMPWLEQIKILALGTVLKAFASNGFGTWAPWKQNYSRKIVKGVYGPSRIALKPYTNKTGMILQDTQQLMGAQDAEIVN